MHGVPVVAMFKFRKLDAVGRLKAGEWSSELEKDGLIKKALGSKGTIDAEDMLDLLLVRDTSVRKAALVRIHQVGDPMIVDAFLRRVEDISPKVVSGLARVLVKVLPEGYHARLAPHLVSEVPRIREAAEELIVSSRLDEKLAEVAQMWLDPKVRVGERLMERISQDVQVGGSLKIWRPVLEQALENPSPDVRRLAFQALANPNDATYFVKMITVVGRETEQNQDTIWKILERLSRSRTVNVSLELVELLGHDSTPVREAAVRYLELLEIKGPVVQSFIHHSKTLSDWGQERAFETLGRIIDQIMDPVLEAMRSSDHEVRILAISLAAGHGDDHRLREPLMQALLEEDWWTRTRVIATLGRMADPDTYGRMAGMLTERDTMLVVADALATAANKHLEAGDRASYELAITPIKALVTGEEILEGSDSDDAADLRRELVWVLARIRDKSILKLLIKICKEDRDTGVASAALDAAARLSEEQAWPIPNRATLQESIYLSHLTEVKLSPMEDIMMFAREQGASDLYIAVGKPPLMRVHGGLQAVEGQPLMDADHTARLLREILSDEQAMTIAQEGTLDYCHEIEGAGRYRASIFVDTRGVNGVFRVIPRDLPSLEMVGLPAHFAEVAYWKSGLVMVCAPQGEGRTTTLAALVDHCNRYRDAHIITLESPIEFIHTSRRCTINQREVGTHTESLARSLHGATRQAPDVIIVDPLEGPEAIKLALRAASIGHLVIAGLRAHGLENALDQIVESFPPESRARILTELSESFKAFIVQGLMPRSNGQGMAAAFEILVANPETRAAMRAGSQTTLRELIDKGKKQGMQSFDDALMGMISFGILEPEVAYRRARKKERFERLVRRRATSEEHA